MSNNPVLPPVFAPRQVRPETPEQAAINLLTPYFQAGILGSVDIHVVIHLGRRVGELDPQVLLAGALAVRAPRFGHICVDLQSITLSDLLPHGPQPPSTQVPALPGPGWLERLRSSPALVRDARDTAGLTPFVLDGSVIYTDRYWRYQAGLAHRLRSWARPGQQQFLADEDFSLLEPALDQLFRPPSGQREPSSTLNLQRVAGAMALLRRFIVVTGGPGMGKTWTVRNLLALLFLRHRARYRRGEVGEPALAVALAAPTGKAAARMREALRAGLSQDFLPTLLRFTEKNTAHELLGFMQDLQAHTLHRLLGYRFDAPTRFRHTQANPLPYDVVVVDESSMVDFPLMAKLVDAVGQQGPAGEPTRLILLGDHHQLASVEAGTVLADICGPTRVDRFQVTRDLATQLERFTCLSGLDRRSDGRTRVEPVEGPCIHDAVVQFNRTFRFDENSGIGAFANACLQTDQLFDAAEAVRILGEGRWGQGAGGDTRLLPYGQQG